MAVDANLSLQGLYALEAEIENSLDASYARHEKIDYSIDALQEEGDRLREERKAHLRLLNAVRRRILELRQADGG